MLALISNNELRLAYLPQSKEFRSSACTVGHKVVGQVVPGETQIEMGPLYIFMNSCARFIISWARFN